MIVGVAIAELHIPGARSLKQKRKVVKGQIDRLHRRFRLSIAEVDHHDLHQRAAIGLALVATGPARAASAMAEIQAVLESSPEAQLTRWEADFVESLL